MLVSLEVRDDCVESERRLREEVRTRKRDEGASAERHLEYVACADSDYLQLCN